MTLKKFKVLGIYILIFLIMLGLPLLLTDPSDAVNSRNQTMIELGLIDDVKSAEELGLEHLLQQPSQLNARLMDNLREAQDIVAQDTANISVAVPLGTDRPVNVGDLTHDNGDSRLTGELDAIGVVTPGGEVEPITPGDERTMFENEEAGRGTLTAFDGSKQKLIADASGSWLQADRVLVFDLIVYKRDNNKVYLVPNVIGDAFCRDALNDVLLNGKQRRNRVNLSRFRF